MFEDDYDYMADLQSKLWASDDLIEDLKLQIQRLGCALLAAGVPAHMVEAIQYGD